MNTPEWLSPGLACAVAGGVAVAVGGLAGAGWTTAAGAEPTGQEVADRQTAAAFVPACVERAAVVAERAARLAIVRPATAATRQRDALMATGLATVGGNAAASRTLATACFAALDQQRVVPVPQLNRTGR